MGYSTVHSCTLSGVQALPVTVEVHTSGGLPGMSIVGLPQSAVRESKDRVKAAIQHIGLKYPQIKIIVNLAPADLPKRGGRFDLPIALGILQATDQLPERSLDGLIVAGELGLTGELRSVTGVLPTAYAFADSAYALFIPMVNTDEALRSTRTRVHGASNLLEAVEHLRQRLRVPLRELARKVHAMGPCSDLVVSTRLNSSMDMADVYGQHKARRALEIAAAGAHNLLMVGPPGTGKSMLASRLPTIQPAMSESEAMETASIASISHTGFDATSWGIRPFRAPHHTASGVALVGGGAHPMPGEISLAHHGVLFLDELPEFSRTVLDVLREPMETGHITVSRAARQAEFPSRFQLVAAMNPCPCGYYNDPSIQCRCGADQILRYQSRVSGPFLDRIDLHLDLQREVHVEGVLTSNADNETSQAIRSRVIGAREIQLERQEISNAALDVKGVRYFSLLDESAKSLLQKASISLSLSLRVQHRLIRVSRTIADLDGQVQVSDAHLAEGLSYRRVPVLNTV
jgi:magnesium chelatase family protein